jgi:hypothetical protein
MSVTLDFYDSAVCAMRKELKLSSDGGVSGSKECKSGSGGAYDGVWRSLYLAEIWLQSL